MTAYLLRRLMQTAVLVAVMSVIVFFGVHVIGDPVWLLVNPQMDQRDIEAAVRALGLDRPIWEQYLHFVSGALRGDLGRSFIFGEPALTVILQRMPATLELAFAALVMAIVVGIPLGLYAGLKPDSSVSKTIMAGSIVGFSLPTFWVGLMLIMVFAVMLGWLPSTGRGADRHLSRHHVQPLHARRPAPPPAAGAQSGAAQDLAGDPPDAGRRTRGPAAGLHQVRPRQGPHAPPHRRRASAEEHPDPGRDGARARVRQPRSPSRSSPRPSSPGPAWASC